jgi:quercetin dioxygenase-like cupin family protein
MTLALNLDLLALARRYAAGLNEVPRFDPTQRWYARIAVTDDHEVWLLTWLPGQGTDLHDHGGSAGAFTVVEGEITEEIVGIDGSLTRGNYAKGDGHSFGPHHVHLIVNASDRPAVTVHAYGPALRTMTRYQLKNGNLIEEYTSTKGADW